MAATWRRDLFWVLAAGGLGLAVFWRAEPAICDPQARDAHR